MQAFQLNTERLLLRQMTQEDFPALCQIMQDSAVMTPVYGCHFTDAEVQAWLERHLNRYRTLGYGLWAVVLKETGGMIGQCGLTRQPMGDQQVLELGYLFASAHWHRGYAAEAAHACRDYAFRVLGAPELYSMIPDFNQASRRVAERIGMQPVVSEHRFFRGRELNFILYRAVP